jgi:hypothetical protein
VVPLPNGIFGGCYVDSTDFHNARRALAGTGFKHQPAWDIATALVNEEQARIVAVAEALAECCYLDEREFLSIVRTWRG